MPPPDWTEHLLDLDVTARAAAVGEAMKGSDGQQRALFLLMALANGKPLGALTLMQAAGHLREHGRVGCVRHGDQHGVE